MPVYRIGCILSAQNESKTLCAKGRYAMARLLILLIALILLFLLAYVACRRPRHVDASPVSDALPDAIASSSCANQISSITPE